MNRGYAGFYNGVFLRSSYEYAYAKYLDYNNIKWEYEKETFDIGYKLYKPDFFIYDNNGNLEFIVEVKSRNNKEIKNAKVALETLKEKYGFNYKLISYQELKILYKSTPFSLTSTIEEWINSANTTINKTLNGKLNPHYNQKHKEKTKILISKSTKARWNDPKVRKKMVEGAKKGAEYNKKRKGKLIKVPRECRFCIRCNKKFIALKTSKQKYCSDICAGIEGFKKANEIYVAQRKVIHDEIKSYVINWCKFNKELINNTPFNRIKTNLQPLLDEIETEFNVKDIRVITQAILGEELGRKELLKFLKSIVNS